VAAGLFGRTFASLRKHRNYRLFFGGQVVSLAGTWMQNIALAWLVVELSDSPLAVGLLAFCRFIPFTLLGLIAGVAVDRFDVRRLVIATQSAQMVVAVALAALTLSGAATLWQAYVLAALGGTALVFDAPGRNALTFQMVGREELPNAVALNSSLFNASRVVGPAVAGGLIAAVGVGWCFAVNATTFVAVLAGLLLMRADELVRLDRGDTRVTVVRGIAEGLRYCLGTPGIRLVLLTVLVVSTAGFNFHVILPLLASETLDAGPEVFGVLSACFGAGALAGALAAASLGRASWVTLLVGTGGFGAAQTLLAPLQSVAGCCILLVFVGVCFTLWTSNANSLVQLEAPDRLRGRVLALYLFAFNGAVPLGGLLTGWLCEVGGTQLALLVGGVASVAMTALALARRPVPAAATA